MLNKVVTLTVLVFMLAISGARAEEASGKAVFEFETFTHNGRYAPKNCIAVWIVDDQKKFVRTLKVCAKKYIRFLKEWKKSSKGNKVDAVTSASLRKHKKHSITWDLKDSDGKVVADGTYYFYVEFTEKNGQGPVLKTVKFEKNGEASSSKPKDEKNFKHMSLKYTP